MDDAGEHLDERRLARAVRADEADDLSLVDAKNVASRTACFSTDSRCTSDRAEPQKPGAFRWTRNVFER